MTDRHDITPEEALARKQVRIKTEGLEAATDAALKLLRDPQAPAQAKSATINAIPRFGPLWPHRRRNTARASRNGARADRQADQTA